MTSITVEGLRTIADNARIVRVRYAGQLEAVQQQIEADRLADPKAPPDSTLTEARWILTGKLRLADELVSLFEDEGL